MGESNTIMQVNYNKFFLKLKESGLTQKEFKEKVGVGGGIIDKMLHNGSVTVATICKICDYFHCMPDDIMEWIPEPAPDENEKEKAELQSQIAELQAKLEKL